LYTTENELGRIPQNVEGGRSDSEGLYRFFKAKMLIETFPNYNQILPKLFLKKIGGNLGNSLNVF